MRPRDIGILKGRVRGGGPGGDRARVSFLLDLVVLRVLCSCCACFDRGRAADRASLSWRKVPEANLQAEEGFRGEKEEKTLQGQPGAGTCTSTRKTKRVLAPTHPSGSTSICMGR